MTPTSPAALKTLAALPIGAASVVAVAVQSATTLTIAMGQVRIRLLSSLQFLCTTKIDEHDEPSACRSDLRGSTAEAAAGRATTAAAASKEAARTSVTEYRVGLRWPQFRPQIAHFSPFSQRSVA